MIWAMKNESAYPWNNHESTLSERTRNHAEACKALCFFQWIPSLLAHHESREVWYDLLAAFFYPKLFCADERGDLYSRNTFRRRLLSHRLHRNHLHSFPHCCLRYFEWYPRKSVIYDRKPPWRVPPVVVVVDRKKGSFQKKNSLYYVR